MGFFLSIGIPTQVIPSVVRMFFCGDAFFELTRFAGLVHLSAGAGVDSGYEYILKQYLLTGDIKARDQCVLSYVCQSYRY
jgi:hypothetical protein